jgi:hypothetical protein
VRGRTPILRHRMAWKRASMAAALGYRLGPDADGAMPARLCVHLQADSYDTDSLIEVLKQLAAFYAGHRVVLVWDGLSSHWSHKMRAHLDARRAPAGIDSLTLTRTATLTPRRGTSPQHKASVFRTASNLPATKPHVATASIVSLHCDLFAEQH